MISKERWCFSQFHLPLIRAFASSSIIILLSICSSSIPSYYYYFFSYFSKAIITIPNKSINVAAAIRDVIEDSTGWRNVIKPPSLFLFFKFLFHWRLKITKANLIFFPENDGCRFATRNHDLALEIHFSRTHFGDAGCNKTIFPVLLSSSSRSSNLILFPTTLNNSVELQWNH